MATGQNANRTPSEHPNPRKNRLKWMVHLPQNGTIGFDPQPHVQEVQNMRGLAECEHSLPPACLPRSGSYIPMAHQPFLGLKWKYSTKAFFLLEKRV